jgi:hypothetical protein
MLTWPPVHLGGPERGQGVVFRCHVVVPDERLRGAANDPIEDRRQFLVLGAKLVSVQKLLGHSDPKITERRYGHLLPEFSSSEVNRLHFGLAGLAQPGSASLALAGSSTPTVTSDGAEAKRRGRNPSGFPRNPGLFCGGVYGT